MRWVLVAGSDRQGGTDGAWGATSTSNMATPNQVNFFDSTSNDFYLTGVQLEFGEVATAFEHRSYGDELLRCFRYYYRVAEGNGAPMINMAVYATNNAYGILRLPVDMRSTPTIESSDATGHFQLQSGGASDTFDTVIAGNGSNRAIELRANSSASLSGAVAGHASWARSTNASAFIAVTAEL